MATPRFNLSSHPTKDTIKLITSLLEKVIDINDGLASKATEKKHDASARDGNVTSGSGSNIYTCFHARSIPSISIEQYLVRILKYCPCDNECFLALLVYFDRMAKAQWPTRTMPLRIDSYNIHRFIITGIMIASKLFSDVFFTNTRYAKVGGLPVSELNVLEVEFLELNNYNLFVTVEEFQHYGDQLLLHWMKEHQGNDGPVSEHGSMAPSPVAAALEALVTSSSSSSPHTHASATNNNNNVNNNSNGHSMECDPVAPNLAQQQQQQPSMPMSMSKSAPMAVPASASHFGSSPATADNHRLFKRPSSQAFGDNTTSPRMNHKAATLSSSLTARNTENKTLPTPPIASPASETQKQPPSPETMK
ncbi:cyclin-domain-containing protein [Gongronella butleri]|nr:cyclin-domain-containing protein [Gongronella butleri]